MKTLFLALTLWVASVSTTQALTCVTHCTTVGGYRYCTTDCY